jgi:hypothetical protein
MTPTEIIAELRRQAGLRNATWPCILLCELMPLCDEFERLESAKVEQEPVAYMWQNDETGNVGFVDPWQIENGWEKGNPRLHIIAPLFRNTAPIPDGMALVPADPTGAMMRAGDARACELADKAKGLWYWGAIYKAMLESAKVKP